MIDLGYGTAKTYIGGPVLEEGAVYRAMDGREVVLRERHLRALAASLVHGNAEAGHRLGVSEKTVKNLLSRLYRQLGVFSKWEAATHLGWTCIPTELLDTPSSEPLGGRPMGAVERLPGSSPPHTCPTCMGIGCGECGGTGR